MLVARPQYANLPPVSVPAYPGQCAKRAPQGATNIGTLGRLERILHRSF